MSTWPSDATDFFERAITVEYASLTKAGVPIMIPVTPYVSSDGTTLDVSTGLTYPTKAERARRNAKVTLLYADGIGSGLDTPPVVMVQGLASVRSADLQANTDRYVKASMAKLPAGTRGTPKAVLRRMVPYFARIWVEVTPVRMLLWDSRELDRAPREWRAPAGTAAPPSDPAPAGKQPAPWLPAPADWRGEADRCVRDLDLADISWAGADGWPVSVPAGDVLRSDSGFRFTLGPFAPGSPVGPATLTFHTHTPAFTTQENRTFIGSVHPAGDGYQFEVQRLLADVSLAGNKLTRTMGFLSKIRVLGTRFDAESARFGQPPPVVRIGRGAS
jgi:hypothetical protein